MSIPVLGKHSTTPPHTVWVLGWFVCLFLKCFEICEISLCRLCQNTPFLQGSAIDTDLNSLTSIRHKREPEDSGQLFTGCKSAFGAAARKAFPDAWAAYHWGGKETWRLGASPGPEDLFH